MLIDSWNMVNGGPCGPYISTAFGPGPINKGREGRYSCFNCFYGRSGLYGLYGRELYSRRFAFSRSAWYGLYMVIKFAVSLLPPPTHTHSPVHLLPLLHESVKLADSPQRQLVHEVDAVRVGDELLAEALDRDWEGRGEHADLVGRVAHADELL